MKPYLANLRQLTFEGQNAEAYWSVDDERIVFQATPDTWALDQLFPLVYGELKVEGARRTLLLYAHYDGQPVDPALWKQAGPFQPVLRDLEQLLLERLQSASHFGQDGGLREELLSILSLSSDAFDEYDLPLLEVPRSDLDPERHALPLPFVKLGAGVEVVAIIDLRARYESVDQGGFTSEADALTNRLRAGFQTAPLKGTAFLAEGVIVDDLPKVACGNDSSGFSVSSINALSVSGSRPTTRASYSLPASAP